MVGMVGMGGGGACRDAGAASQSALELGVKGQPLPSAGPAWDRGRRVISDRPTRRSQVEALRPLQDAVQEAGPLWAFRSVSSLNCLKGF